MKRWSKVAALVAIALLVASGSFAQTTGRIEGTVQDSNGAPLPGVTLTATGPTLPGQITVYSGDDGRFRMLAVPVGTYTVTATLDGFNTVEQRDIRVGIDRSVSLSLTLTAAFAGEVTVLGEAPVVDTTSATSGLNVTAETFERIPLQRDFYKVAQISTGATGDDTVGATIYGSTGAENQYIIEGLNTTGAELGNQGKDINFDFIQEVEIKTGGLPAEYGRLTGGLLNAITKSGGNEFSGDVFAFYSDFADDKTGPDRPRSTTRVVGPDSSLEDLGVDLGGYFVKDKVWFFAAYAQKDEPQVHTVVQDLGPGAPVAGDVIKEERESDLYAGKLTWRINSSNNLSASIFGDPEDREGPVLGISGTEETWRGTRELGSDDYVVRYDGVFGGSWVVEGLYGLHQEEDNTDGLGAGRPQFIDQRATPTLLSNGFGFYQQQEFERESVKADVSKFLGKVELKFGVDQEDTSAVNNNFNGGAGQRIYIFDQDGRADVRDEATTYYRHRYYIDDQAPGFNRNDPSTWVIAAPLTSEPNSVSTAAYAQGSIKLASNFTLNLGVRYERQEINDRSGNTAIDIDDNWAPRIGFAWDPGADGRSKLYGAYGRYYENVPLDINIRAFGGEITCFCYNFSPDPNDYLQDPNAPRAPSLLGGSLEPVDPGLKGQYIDEYLLGYEYEVLPNFALGIQATYRDLGRVIEDFLVIEEGNYFIANPGEGQFGRTVTFYDYSTAPAPKAKREFTGVEINAKKRYSDGWQLYASYLWSELEGNYDGLFQNSTGQLDPNINSAFDYADFLVNANGKLSTDREHQFKVNGSYTLQDGPLKDLTLGLSAYYATGFPATAMGYSFLYQNWEYYLTPRGSVGRHPDSYEADFHVDYPIRFGNDLELQLILDVFNLLDRQGIIQYDEQYNRPETDDGLPDGLDNGDGGWDHVPGTLQPVGQLSDPKGSAPNPDFLRKGINFTGERQIRFGVRLRF